MKGLTRCVVSTYMHVHMYVCTYMYVRMHVYMYYCMYLCMCMYICMSMYTLLFCVVLVSKKLFSSSYNYLNDGRNQDFSFT